MDYFIGLDIGTSSAKAVAFLTDGSILAKHAISYGTYHPKADWCEQDPYEIIEATILCMNKIAGTLAGHHPLFISFSAALHGLIAVGEDDKLLTRCIIYSDNRAVEIAEQLRSIDLGKYFYHRTGVPVHAMSPLCKLVWLKENSVDVFCNTSKFISIKEFVLHSLFGKYIVDTAIASATGLLNIHSLEWDETILDFIGINKSQLSALVSTHHIEYLPAGHPFTKRLPDFSTTAFVMGGSDGGLANFGSGAMEKGTMAITIGTSGAARMVTREAHTDTRMRTFCYHLKEDYFITGGASNNGGIVLQWLKENILQNGETTEEFFNLATLINPGSEDFLFLPYILGERAPLWNSNARGVFFGLSITHGRAHLVRAAMEAVIFNLYSIGKILIEKAPITIIYANGGFANSTSWIQMLADVFNVPVFVNGIEESSAWGPPKWAWKQPVCCPNMP
ncbi:MAG: carbohydrate kinase [Ferruginibacter sp.]|nr:carbohydrate kinase [Ferruginibacter sp.]